MKNNLKLAMRDLNDIDFRELSYAVKIAEKVRHMMKRFSLSAEYMAEALGIDKIELFFMLNGSHDFDLMMLSKIDSLNETLALEAAKKEIVPIINFPDYKYSATVEQSDAVKRE